MPSSLSVLICKMKVIHTKPYKVGVIMTTVLQGEKLRIREVEELAQGHTAREAQDWNSLGLLILPPSPLPFQSNADKPGYS